MAFTAFGSWQICARRGSGEVTPGGVLVSEGWAEHECRHPDGADDRMLCVLYLDAVDPGPALVVPQVAALHSLRRSLAAELRRADPDPGEVEALSLALRLVATNPVLRDTTIMFALFNIGEGALLVFLPQRAVELGLGSGGYGFLVAATMAGELLASLVLARRIWTPSLRASIVAAQITAALLVLLLVIHLAAVTVAALGALGRCTAPMTAWAQSLRMRLAPPQAHGRLFALLRTAMQATPPAGAALAALTLSYGTPATVAAVAAVMGLPAVALAHNLMTATTTAPAPAPQTR